MYPRQSQSSTGSQSVRRVRIMYALLLGVIGIFVIRLFYLQVIRHDYYTTAAQTSQLKEYEIRAERGIIEAYDGDSIIPIVLNEERYTLFADPYYVKDPSDVAQRLTGAVGGNSEEFESKMRQETRYVVLAKKLDKAQRDSVDALALKGVGTREESYRTYPQGALASQLLGFVNDDGEGKYGVEEYLDGELKGLSGQLKAITDAQGVPLASSKDNIVKQPESGQKVVLTIDISMQRQLEDILKEGLESSKSVSGSAIIMEVDTGAIKAMANYPTYNPAEFYKQEDASVFTNAAVSEPLEVGSSMKTLTTAAALDQGVVNKNTSYYDPSQFKIDDATVKNIEEDGGPGTRTVSDILQMSLNTGATWLLMQMGGGEINQKARTTWYDYLTNHYQFGRKTGIEQGYEAEGYVPRPDDGFGLNITYANTTFGQGMSTTMVQMAGAVASIVNGGTYYQPYLVDRLVAADGQEAVSQPKVVGEGSVSASVSQTMRELMEYTFSKNHRTYGLQQLPAGYSLGGKTGTAQIAKPDGGYYDDKYNGTFVGYIGGDKPEYVIVVRASEPKVPGYAGAKAAAPIYIKLVSMLINNYGIEPKH